MFAHHKLFGDFSFYMDFLGSNLHIAIRLTRVESHIHFETPR